MHQIIFFRALQGLSTGAGIVVTRAVLRDIFPPADAQRVMSQITIFFGIAPAVAPMLGGVLNEYWGCASVFWFMVGVGVVLIAANVRLLPENQILRGFRIMLVVSAINVMANAVLTPHVWWALWPLVIFAFGWALMVPVVTLLVLDLVPERRGMASSLQAVVGSVANGLVAGVVSPLVMHSALLLAVTSAIFMAIGLIAWLGLHERWPDIGALEERSAT